MLADFLAVIAVVTVIATRPNLLLNRGRQTGSERERDVLNDLRIVQR